MSHTAIYSVDRYGEFHLDSTYAKSWRGALCLWRGMWDRFGHGNLLRMLIGNPQPLWEQTLVSCQFWTDDHGRAHNPFDLVDFRWAHKANPAFPGPSLEEKHYT